MERVANQPSSQPAQAPPPAPACPRCRPGLSTTRCHVRRGGLITALLCPSITCGYKLILPS